MRRLTVKEIVYGALLFFASLQVATAQESSAVDAVAREFANPNSLLASLKFDN